MPAYTCSATCSSMKLVTKILRKLACMSREAPRFLDLEQKVFRQQHLLVTTLTDSLPCVEKASPEFCAVRTRQNVC